MSSLWRRASVWDQLTPEERAVMLIAIEGGYLNGVIYEHDMRVNGKRFGDALVAPPISEEAVSAMVPQFSKVAADLFGLP